MVCKGWSKEDRKAGIVGKLMLMRGYDCRGNTLRAFKAYLLKQPVVFFFVVIHAVTYVSCCSCSY